MYPTPRPHDLLWGLRSEHLAQEAPAWARAALGGHVPVVVRRAPAESGWVAVGIRGTAREQRHATWMRVSDVSHRVSPQAVARAGRWRSHAQPHWPALRALSQLAPRLDTLGLAWGVTGSLGFELASGLSAVHPASDLDLLVRAPLPLSRAWAQNLCEWFDGVPARVDLQLETPYGALALREWASGATRVMLKREAGPVLVGDPWAAEQAVA
ncbi:malonate decarboxylase holo-ACP synthase [Pseudomonas kuykendallii]|uniref:Phosphoribosyl-dephospho-CoA transferase n=1 Tax=Pseudomonas kuykendallii TaxID=1007099 RepID=A0A2W5ERI0_9PSED|nr:malonate decarboxylase holo-ACP synthase [Pseudomonas kuykendallii]PZP22676.1 MAG: phosphoribosyl-dephospho-CoA transferase [Pseudomonas kuykendallii]